MGAADMLKVNDYTKSKQRILYYILYGISGLELLFAIIGLAAGGKNGATRFFSTTTKQHLFIRYSPSFFFPL